jgi:hypothetical protein
MPCLPDAEALPMGSRCAARIWIDNRAVVSVENDPPQALVGELSPTDLDAVRRYIALSPAPAQRPPLPSSIEALAEPFGAFPSWSRRPSATAVSTNGCPTRRTPPAPNATCCSAIS